MAVNQYGRMAMDHCRTQRPRAFAEIQDRIGHFTALGEQIQAAVTAARDEILGSRMPQESLDDYRSRSLQAIRVAEETVLADLVWLPAEPTETPVEPDQLLSDHYRRLQEIDEVTAQDL